MAHFVRPSRVIAVVLCVVALLAVHLSIKLVVLKLRSKRPLELKITCQLNDGGFSKVYLAEVPGQKGRIAVKHVILKRSTDRIVEEEEVLVMENEAKLLSQCQGHPFIVRYHRHKYYPHMDGAERPIISKNDSDSEILGDFFIAMEYIAGSQDLWEVLNVRSLTLDEQRVMGREMVMMLRVLHANRVVFGDFKVENLLYARGHVKLIDFGSARWIDGPKVGLIERTRPPTDYILSPELLDESKRRENHVEFTDDVWALGVALFYMFHRRSPFNPYRADSLSEARHADASIMRKRMNQLIDAYYESGGVLDFDEACPEDLRNLIQQLLLPNFRRRLVNLDVILKHRWLSWRSYKVSPLYDKAEFDTTDQCKLLTAPIHLVM